MDYNAIIHYRLRGIDQLITDQEDRQAAAKKFIIFCLTHENKEMRKTVAKIVEKELPQYKDLLEKYLILS